MSDGFLQLTDVHKSFGGVAATDHIDLSVTAGEVHAIIGPNGAGKTTLISQLAGELRPDGGRIELQGRDITHLSAAARSHLGVARSFQITSIIHELSVLDNVLLAVQAHAGHSFRFFGSARREARLVEPARATLAQVGLADYADHPAGPMSHGAHRQLEIAMALASQPRLLLLDEPMAGIGPDEGQRMIDILGALKGQTTMLLIEHDMDAVFALADRISVLVYGRIIATDTPAAIRSDENVRRAYLGEPVQC
jgi:branched-chain amino acid transport system ATP-binding protein